MFIFYSSGVHREQTQVSDEHTEIRFSFMVNPGQDMKLRIVNSECTQLALKHNRIAQVGILGMYLESKRISAAVKCVWLIVSHEDINALSHYSFIFLFMRQHTTQVLNHDYIDVACKVTLRASFLWHSQ